MAERRTHYLAVDIGGTKTAVALFAADDPAFSVLEYKRYRSSQFGGIEEIVEDFTRSLKQRPTTVCLGVAGVVDGSEARLTNLPWVIDAGRLQRHGFEKVALINDMTALAASLPLLNEADLHCLQPGSARGEIAAILAPGTGLGEGFLSCQEDDCRPIGTEGGHCDFAPLGDVQVELLHWMMNRSGGRTVSYEMVCAGPAIASLYDFFLAQGEIAVERVARRLREVEDRTPVIAEAAIAGSCPVCCKAIDLFLAILGREGANLAMKVYARRGLFLGGGILPRLAEKVDFSPFLNSFRMPGAMAELLRTVPVNIIIRPDSVLLGAAWHARKLAITGMGKQGGAHGVSNSQKQQA